MLYNQAFYHRFLLVPQIWLCQWILMEQHHLCSWSAPSFWGFHFQFEWIVRAPFLSLLFLKLFRLNLPSSLGNIFGMKTSHYITLTPTFFSCLCICTALGGILFHIVVKLLCNKIVNLGINIFLWTFLLCSYRDWMLLGFLCLCNREPY